MRGTRRVSQDILQEQGWVMCGVALPSFEGRRGHLFQRHCAVMVTSTSYVVSHLAQEENTGIISCLKFKYVFNFDLNGE